MLVEFAQLVAAAAPAEAMDVSHWSLLDIRSQSADEMGGVSDEVQATLESCLFEATVLSMHVSEGAPLRCLCRVAGVPQGGERSEGGVENMGRNAHASAHIPFAPPQQTIRFDL